jgi:glycosyltransferase involved in cell wall biosynthesis
MRVGLVADRLQANEPTSGMTRYIENLVRYLPQFRPDVELVLLGSDLPLESGHGPASKGLSSVSLPGYPRHKRASIRSLEYWLSNARATPIIHRLGLDVIHAPVQSAPLYFWFARRPKVITIHGVADALLPSSQHWRLRAGLALRRRLLSAQKPTVVTVSHAEEANLSKVYNLRQMHMIYHCVDLSSLGSLQSHQDASSQVASRYGTPPRYLLHVSHYQPKKNLPAVLHALAQLRDEHNLAIHLIIAGEPKFGFEVVQKTICDLNLADQVTLVGQVQGQQLLDLLCGAYALVVASLHESFGIPALEGMTCGTPVIASNVYSLPEVTGGAALLVDPHSPASIAEAIRQLWASEELRAELRTKGLRRAEDFSPRHFAEAHVQVYETAAARG